MDPCRVEAINEYFNTLGIELIKKSEWDYSFRKVKDYAEDNFGLLGHVPPHSWQSAK